LESGEGRVEGYERIRNEGWGVESGERRVESGVEKGNRE